MSPQKDKKPYGARTKPVDLSQHFNFPLKVPKDKWWQDLVGLVARDPVGDQISWGIPFKMADGTGPRAVCVDKNKPEVTIELDAKASYLCFIHYWWQRPETIKMHDPQEGLVVGEYELTYSDGEKHTQPVRGRFEVRMAESIAYPWLAMRFNMDETLDPMNPPQDIKWGNAQTGTRLNWGNPLHYAMPNPYPDRKIKSLTIRGVQESPLLVSGLTLYQGADHPLRHLPRRTYRIKAGDKPVKVTDADLDLGVIARIQHTDSPRDKKWLESGYAGLTAKEAERDGEDLIEATGAPDATMTVKIEGQRKPLKFSLGEAFDKGKSESGEAVLQVLGKKRHWMKVRVIDGSTGKPTPVRIHFSGKYGDYIAPHGHHEQVNVNWFEDYGADVVAGGRPYAYVNGEFTTDLPVDDLYVEINKGFEYEPVRQKVSITPGQEVLELQIDRWKDLRSQGWVTADTHVHFISPHTAWLEAQAEGVNVVNLLASQWGRLFTNVGDYIGRVGISENDTIVYVGTENRNHMLGHMSMLGTQGLPVYPMCCGGPSESWVGDPDFMMMAEWALENRRKGGLTIRPHFPSCGHTEDPLPILKGLVDALEIRLEGYALQEWYRYLNCGYRVSVVGGTDKMSAGCPVGWLRTYAKVDTNQEFTFDTWADAVRAGRTISTNGPLLDLRVEGLHIGDSIRMPEGGGTLEVQATAECFRDLSKIEIIYNGQVIATESAGKGARVIHFKDKIRVPGSGWIAARSFGVPETPSFYLAAHTSPVYIKCGETRAFDGPAMEHMLALVEGGIEYLNTLATVFDESSRKRMTKLFNEARQELKGRLVIEGQHIHHHGDGVYHTHGHGLEPGHSHK